MSDISSEGIFVYEFSQTPIGFEDFGPNEGSGAGYENCVYFDRFHDYKWNDGPCNDLRLYVCEAPL